MCPTLVDPRLQRLRVHRRNAGAIVPFLFFVLSRQRLLRAHVEVSEVGGPGPSFVGGRAEGEREGGLSRVTDP